MKKDIFKFSTLTSLLKAEAEAELRLQIDQRALELIRQEIDRRCREDGVYRMTAKSMMV